MGSGHGPGNPVPKVILLLLLTFAWSMAPGGATHASETAGESAKQGNTLKSSGNGQTANAQPGPEEGLADTPVKIRDAKTPDKEELQLTSVIFHGRELFEIAPVSEVDSELSATELVERLESLAENPRFRTDTLELVEDESLGVILIKSKKHYVTAVFSEEADLLERNHHELAVERLEAIRKAIDGYRESFSLESIGYGVLYSALLTGLLLLLLVGLRKLRRWLTTRVAEKLEGHVLGRLLKMDSSFSLIRGVVRILYILLLLWIFSTYVNLILSFFPWTFGIAAIILDFALDPVERFLQTFVDQIPNLFTLALIVFGTLYLIRFIRAFFAGLEKGTITIKGFYRDWAPPTFQIVRIVIIAFAAVAAFPYIPGSGTPAFKGVSIFLGVLFSLGSSSVVANVIAGLMLTYMRPFMLGDRVCIGETHGIVGERRLLSTRIQTLTNQMVTVPNTILLGTHIINYSAIKKKGLFLKAEVTIGYDIPWRKVYQLLLDAAERTEGVVKDPPPFVLQTALEDFYIRYVLNAPIQDPRRMPHFQSSLLENIQDCFAEAGVEIMSPHYQQHRADVAGSALPTDND